MRTRVEMKECSPWLLCSPKYDGYKKRLCELNLLPPKKSRKDSLLQHVSDSVMNDCEIIEICCGLLVHVT